MTLVSYAQNYEDIMLFRALGDIEHGIYVDVGAQDPVEDSVTRLFYERGWRGINIEPVRHWYERLMQDRPEDTNLRLLVTDHPGVATFYEVEDTGLSTLDASLAASHASAGRHVISQTLQCATLDDILAQHPLPEIHFLKVDVEGAETQVLRGLSLRQHRPWVLVIEACAPNSTMETHGEWEPGVLAAGYKFVYRDGLNRFYLADEHSSRKGAFSVPPNILDGFIRYGEWRVRHELALLRVASDDQGRQIEVLQASVNQRDAQLDQWRARAAELAAQAEQLQRTSDEYRAQVGQWSLRAEELSAHLERLQQVSDARQAQLVEVSESAAREIAAREAKVVDVKAELMAMRAAHEFLAMEAQRQEAFLAQILSSRSWRLTRPMRALGRLVRYGPDELVSALRARMHFPRVIRVARGIMRFLPGVGERLPAHEPPVGPQSREQDVSCPPPADPLSDRAEEALAMMERARGRLPGQGAR